MALLRPLMVPRKSAARLGIALTWLALLLALFISAARTAAQLSFYRAPMAVYRMLPPVSTWKRWTGAGNCHRRAPFFAAATTAWSLAPYLPAQQRVLIPVRAASPHSRNKATKPLALLT